MKTTTETTQTEQIIKSLINASELKGSERLVFDFEMIYTGFVSSQVYEDMDGQQRELMTLTFLHLQKALQGVVKLTEGINS